MIPRNFDFLREKFPLEEAFFFVPLKILYPLIAFRPFKEYTNLEYALVVLNGTTPFIGGVMIFITTLQTLQVDLVTALKNVGYTLSMVVSAFKYFYLLRKIKKFGQVMEYGRSLFFVDNECNTVDYKRKMSQKALANASRICFLVYFSCFLVATTNGLSLAIQMTIQYLMEGEFTKVTIFYSYLPECFKAFPQYPIYYIFMMYTSFVGGVVIGVVDGGFAYFSFSISGIFKMIQYDIEEVLKKYGDRGDAYVMTNKAEVALVLQKLGVLIQRQCDTQQLSRDSLEIFSTMIFIHFITSAIVICAVCFAVLVRLDGYDIIPCGCYLSGVLTQLFIYCYGASLVEEDSSKIAEAAYASNWYHVDLKIRKMILIIMNRSQKPVVLQVPFFVPSLQAFNSIISTAGSYIALMKSFL